MQHLTFAVCRALPSFFRAQVVALVAFVATPPPSSCSISMDLLLDPPSRSGFGLDFLLPMPPESTQFYRRTPARSSSLIHAFSALSSLPHLATFPPFPLCLPSPPSSRFQPRRRYGKLCTVKRSVRGVLRLTSLVVRSSRTVLTSTVRRSFSF
jgi:hypothetical protein